MSEPKVKCKECGREILVATAEATGGFCRNGVCETVRAKKRKLSKRTIQRQIDQCPQCGKGVRSSRLDRHIRERCELCPRVHPYADTFPPTVVPEWIENLSSASSLSVPIPLIDILRDSCFYPASGLDASPVLLVNGYIHSFIFVDYSTDRTTFLRQLFLHGFRPYELILQRDIDRQEIVPAGWTSQIPRYFDNPGFDGHQRLLDVQRRCNPFGHWSIWQRREKRGDWVGPRLFSFLFLGGEAIASYQGLYIRNQITPKVMVIIQPGHACGDNWTNFNDPNAPLWETVSQGEELPECLLIGGYGRTWSSEECPFDGYTFIKRTTTYEDGRTGRTIDIFKRHM